MGIIFLSIKIFFLTEFFCTYLFCGTQIFFWHKLFLGQNFFDHIFILLAQNIFNTKSSWASNLLWTKNSFWSGSKFLKSPKFILHNNFLSMKFYLDPMCLLDQKFFGPEIVFGSNIFLTKYYICFDLKSHLTVNLTQIRFLLPKLLNCHLDNWCKDNCHSDSCPLTFVLLVKSLCQVSHL